MRHHRSLKVATLTTVLACLLTTGVEITPSLARPHPTDLRSEAVAFARATKADFRSALSGIASVYRGGGTATGEDMNPRAMPAAHKTLPFGSMVTVVNRRNGRVGKKRVQVTYVMITDAGRRALKATSAVALVHRPRRRRVSSLHGRCPGLDQGQQSRQRRYASSAKIGTDPGV
jgi:hypothetical protein